MSADYAIIYERGGVISNDRKGKKSSLRPVRPDDAPAFALQLRAIHEDQIPQLGLSVELGSFNAVTAAASVQRATGCTWDEAWEAVAGAIPELFADHWLMPKAE